IVHFPLARKMPTIATDRPSEKLHLLGESKIDKKINTLQKIIIIILSMLAKPSFIIIHENIQHGTHE
ncbi:hypothetical protein, partial [Xenorhabdus bovienii]|uniref:hypothetical protein n=1 Tax=Xenorhabdus bovienii TaxID=40576 RepID=UPI0023B3476C